MHSSLALRIVHKIGYYRSASMPVAVRPLTISPIGHLARESASQSKGTARDAGLPSGFLI